MTFKVEKLYIPDILLIKPSNKAFYDKRGFFMESYKKSEFYNIGIKENFVQDNFSVSIKNVVRGLHFQTSPKEQGKLVRCLNGCIFDFAVDLRKDSPFFKKWVSVKLSSRNKLMLYVPPGFAHGFLSVCNLNAVFYKTTSEYDPKYEKGIKFDDPDININWGIDKEKIIISDKDFNLPYLKDFISDK